MGQWQNNWYVSSVAIRDIMRVHFDMLYHIISNYCRKEGHAKREFTNLKRRGVFICGEKIFFGNLAGQVKI